VADAVIVENASKFRAHRGALGVVLRVLYFSLTLIGVLWAAELQNTFNLSIFREQYLALMLGIGLVTIFIAVKARAKEPAGIGVPWHDWLAILGSILVCGYVVVRYPVLVTEISATTPDRWALGALAVFLILEATRRLLGWTLIWLALVFILYARFSDFMPGVLNAPSSDWARLSAYLYLDTNSVLGLPLTVMAEIVIAFILFGRVLYAMSADKFLTDAALAAMGRYRGGPAKVAVGASSLFGTISGSAVSNVVMVGPISIPMMIRAGYAPHVAGAIEAVASTGGQIMPPVMGITAFLIADWLGLSYGEVVVAAALPAIFYYVALFVQIDLEAAKSGLVGLPRTQIPPLLPVLRRGWVFFVPIAVLVYLLIALAWQPGRAAVAAILVAIPAGMITRETRPNLKKLWIAMCETGQSVLELVAITALAGLVIGALQISGLAFGLSLMLVGLAQGNVLLLLLLTAAICMVLGMGLPTAVIYILLAIMVAPTLTQFGIVPLAAHLFLFYFGMISMITPPMCLATFAAATIARCNFWRAGWTGTRLGIVAYIIPFFFVFNPGLLLMGKPLDILLTVTTAFIGIVLVAASCAGYLFATMAWPNRAIFFLAGLCLIPSPLGGPLWLSVNLAGLAAGLLVVTWQYRKRAAPALA
jgi:TRAP transporter 4TM/12TM fusion protein